MDAKKTSNKPKFQYNLSRAPDQVVVPNPLKYHSIENALCEKYGFWNKTRIRKIVEDIRNDDVFETKPYWYNLEDADIRLQMDLYGDYENLIDQKATLDNILMVFKSIYGPEYENLKKIGEGLYAQKFLNSLPKSNKSHDEKEQDYNALESYQFGIGSFNTLPVEGKNFINNYINETLSEYSGVGVKLQSDNIQSVLKIQRDAQKRALILSELRNVDGSRKLEESESTNQPFNVKPVKEHVRAFLKSERKSGEDNDCLKLWLIKGAELTPNYGMPILAPCNKKPRKAIPFDRILRTDEKNQWVHFFIDDQRFECVWDNPREYLDQLKSFDGIIGTDFSLYLNMPLPLQKWNTYRNRALAFWFQSQGVNVIPNVQWGLECSYEFCFDGIPENSVVAISTYGCIQDKAERFYFKKGLNRMVKHLKPKTIVVYSYLPDDIFLPYKKTGIEIIHIPNWNETVRERGVV